MQVLITEVTRMERGYICVAGINRGTGSRVRPVLSGGARIPLTWVSSLGGLIDNKRVLEIGDGPRVGKSPEVEDVLTSSTQLRLVTRLSDEEFLTALRGTSHLDARSAFGPELKQHVNGHNYVSAEGTGTLSLAIQANPRDTVEVFLTNFGRIRARWRDGMELSVTDLRLYQPDGSTPNEERVATLSKALKDGPGFVAFGLTRAMSLPRSGDPSTYHWLQVNAIHVPVSLQWSL